MIDELLPATRVVLFYEDDAGFCCWARLDNGLELQVTADDLWRAGRVPFLSVLNKLNWLFGFTGSLMATDG